MRDHSAPRHPIRHGGRGVRLAALCLLLCLPPPAAGEVVPLDELEAAERAARLAEDAAAVARYRAAQHRALEFARSRPDLFPPRREDAPMLPGAATRTAARALWQRLLDYDLALESVHRYYADYAALTDESERERALVIAYAAYLAQYRGALDFIAGAGRNPVLDVLLNEPLPGFGLPDGSYAGFKFRYLNVLRAAESAAFDLIYRATGGEEEPDLRTGIKEDAERIAELGAAETELLGYANGLDILQRFGASLFFPVQAGIAEWMGRTRLDPTARALVAPEQVVALAARLRPGDILLERREGYLSNIGLPGFWPHSALYIGTPRERRRYFDDPGVRAWVRSQGVASGEFEELLAREQYEAYRASLDAEEDGRALRVIEAVSAGVVFSTLEHTADADTLAVLRPRLPKREKAIALYRAFGYHGRPYDFDFEFRSDAALVCTELVYKSYEPGAGMRGLRLPLIEILGRLAIPANDIVRQFDEQYGRAEQQTDLIAFLDGDEAEGVARPETIAEFRRSWRRPRWTIFAEPPDAAGESIGSGAANEIEGAD